MHAYREALLYLKHIIVKMGMLLLIGFHPTVTKTLLLLFLKSCLSTIGCGFLTQWEIFDC